MKKGIILSLGFFLALIISFTLVSALGTQYVCLNKGERIYFSDCNPSMEDYLCTSTNCKLCVTEIRTGVYCSGGNPEGCMDECTYLYDEPEPPVIAPPIEDSTNVVLISPKNNYILDAPAQVIFSFKTIKKTQTTYFKICELVIDGEVAASKTSSIYFNKQFDLKSSLTNGVHTWRIYCTERDTDGGEIIMSEQRTITVGNAPGTVCGNNIKEGTEQCDDGNTANGDGCSSICKIEQEQQTEIELITPANAYTATDTQNIEFKFGISNSVLSSIVGCNLILNNNNVNNTAQISSQNILSVSVSPADYTWRIDCLDNLQQTTSSVSRTFTINSPAAAPVSGGSSGGGGGGGGGGGSSAPTYTLNQEQLNNGTTQSLQKSARFKFKILNEDHYATVDVIATTYVQLTVSSEPQKFLLYTADEKKIDVNNDKVYDLSLVLNKIESNKANITIKAISEPIPGEALEGTESAENNETDNQTSQNRLAGITGAVIGTISNNKIYTAIGFIIIIVIIGISLYSHQKKKQNKEE